MALTSGGRFLGRYAGPANLRGTYVAGNCRRTATILTQSTRYKGRYVGLAEDGRPVYVTAPCSIRNEKLSLGQRYESRYTGVAEDGRPVYMVSCSGCRGDGGEASCADRMLAIHERVGTLSAIVDGPDWLSQSMDLIWGDTCVVGSPCFAQFHNIYDPIVCNCRFVFGTYHFLRVDMSCFQGGIEVEILPGCADTLGNVQFFAGYRATIDKHTFAITGRGPWNYTTSQCGPVITLSGSFQWDPLFLYVEGIYPCPDNWLGYSYGCNYSQNIRLNLTISEP